MCVIGVISIFQSFSIIFLFKILSITTNVNSKGFLSLHGEFKVAFVVTISTKSFCVDKYMCKYTIRKEVFLWTSLPAL
jgi:hypothetical protein